MALNLPRLQTPVVYIQNNGRIAPSLRKHWDTFASAIETNDSNQDGLITDLQDAQDALTAQQADIDDLNSWQTDTINDLIDLTNDLVDVTNDLSDLNADLLAYVNQIYLDYAFADHVLQVQINNLASYHLGGTVTASPSSGYVNIAHGMGFDPGLPGCAVQVFGTTAAIVNLASTTSAYIVVYVMDLTGTAYAGSLSLAWTYRP